MSQNSNKQKLSIELEVEELSPKQIRILKSVINMISCAGTAEDETEYFETCGELFQSLAHYLKHSNYIASLPLEKQEDYSNQAIEYSIDKIEDVLDGLNTPGMDQ